MGAAGGAGPLSLLSLGLSVGSSVMSGLGKKSEMDFAAAKAERAAEFGKVQAELTDTTMRENLNTTIGQIDAIRAAGNNDPLSPTTAAVEDLNTKRSDRQRTAALVSIRSQVAEDEASAQYLRKAGNFALLNSVVGAGAKFTGGLYKGKYEAA